MRSALSRPYTILALVLLCCAAPPATAETAGAPVPEVRPGGAGFALGEPSRLYAPVGLLVEDGEQDPALYVAQRAIDRDLGGRGPIGVPENPDDYVWVEVDGWKSPVQAALMSAALPGAGQWYNGSKSRYLFLGVEALALASFFHFRGESRDKRNEAVLYAGDPENPSSRWSFDEFEAAADPDDVARLRDIYARDRDEFYSLVSSDGRYLAGWQGSGDEEAAFRSGYLSIDGERRDAEKKSRLGLFTAIANRVASVVEAVRGARLNNFQLQEDLELKLDAKTGSRGRIMAVVTHTFQ